MQVKYLEIKMKQIVSAVILTVLVAFASADDVDRSQGKLKHAHAHD